jgi:hypothetical protein
MITAQNYQYKIIAYPLDAVVVTPKLFFSGSCITSQSWSYDETEAQIYTDYMEAFHDLMKIKRKNNLFLILLHNEHKTN